MKKRPRLTLDTTEEFKNQWDAFVRCMTGQKKYASRDLMQAALEQFMADNIDGKIEVSFILPRNLWTSFIQKMVEIHGEEYKRFLPKIIGELLMKFTAGKEAWTKWEESSEKKELDKKIKEKST